MPSEIGLDYVGKLYDALATTRSYTNRLMLGIVFVSLFVIAAATETVRAEKISGLGAEFTATLWVVLLAGAVFLAIAPGFAIGRLGYMQTLAIELHRMYALLDPCWESHRNSAVDPFEVSAVMTESSAASRRRKRDAVALPESDAGALPDSDASAPPASDAGALSESRFDRRVMRFNDFIGGPAAAWMVLGVLPVAAQGAATVNWVRSADDGAAFIGLVGGLLVIATGLSTWLAAKRWLFERTTGGRNGPVPHTADAPRD